MIKSSHSHHNNAPRHPTIVSWMQCRKKAKSSGMFTNCDVRLWITTYSYAYIVSIYVLYTTAGCVYVYTKHFAFLFSSYLPIDVVNTKTIDCLRTATLDAGRFLRFNGYVDLQVFFHTHLVDFVAHHPKELKRNYPSGIRTHDLRVRRASAALTNWGHQKREERVFQVHANFTHN